ncbi:MAG: sigma-70 family RNA polymerase sigma factor [Planctomycetota bacterium]
MIFAEVFDLECPGEGGREDSAPEAGCFGPEAFERFRGYLRVLAETGIRRRPELRARFDASDIVQETLLRAVRGSASFQGSSDAELAGWLRRILANQLANCARALSAAKRDAHRERSLEALVEDSAARIRGAVEKVMPSPDVSPAEQDFCIEVAEALVGLPADQRAAFVLKHLGGLALSEVSRDMGRSPQSVAGLLRRAAATLRKKLRGYDPRGTAEGE